MSRAHRRDKYAPRGRDTRGTLARAISSTLLLPSHPTDLAFLPVDAACGGQR